MRGSPETGARDSRAGQSRRADARLCCGLFQRRAVIINRHERAHEGIFFLSFRSKHESPFTGQTASTLSFTELWQRRPRPVRRSPHSRLPRVQRRAGGPRHGVPSLSPPSPARRCARERGAARTPGGAPCAGSAPWKCGSCRRVTGKDTDSTGRGASGGRASPELFPAWPTGP